MKLMKTLHRGKPWKKCGLPSPVNPLKFVIVLIVGCLQILYGSTARADASYDFYAQHIQSDLGPEYLEQFKQLTIGDFRYPPHSAQYMVYAFYHGWWRGYYVGSLSPYNRANHFDNHQQQLESQWWQDGRNQVNQWVGLRPDESRMVMNFLDSGFKAGHERGYRDAVTGTVQQTAPQPTQGDFRRYYQPPGLIGPPSSGDEDIWGDLRNRP